MSAIRPNESVSTYTGVNNISNYLSSDIPDNKLKDLLTFSLDITHRVSNLNLKQALYTFVHDIQVFMKVESCAVFLISESAPEIELSYSYTDAQQFQNENEHLDVTDRPHGGLTGYIATGKIVCECGEKLRNHPNVQGIIPHHLGENKCMSMLGVPLKDRKQRNNIGVLKLENKKGPDGKPSDTLSFDEADKLAIQIFARQIVMLLEQQRVADKIQNLIDSIDTANDIDAILTTILKTGLELLRIENGSVCLLDEDSEQLIYSSFLGESTLEVGYPVPEVSIANSVFANCKSKIDLCKSRRVDNVKDAEDYCQVHSETCSQMSVPLKGENGCIGVFNFESPVPGFFDDKDQAVLEQVAQYSVLAYKIVNKETRFFGIAEYLPKETSARKHLLQKVLDSVRNIYGLAGGIFYTVNEKEEKLQCSAYSDKSFANPNWKSFSQSFSGISLAAEAYRNQRPVFTEDPATDPRVDPRGVAEFEIKHSLMAIPLIYEYPSLAYSGVTSPPRKDTQKKIGGVLVAWSREKLEYPCGYYVSRIMPFASMVAAYMASSDQNVLQREILELLTKTLVDIQKSDTANILEQSLFHIITAGQLGGFDNVYIQRYNKTSRSCRSLELWASPLEIKEQQTAEPFTLRPAYTGLNRRKALRDDLQAEIGGPKNRSDRVRPKSAPGTANAVECSTWAHVPLKVSGQFYGQMIIENASSNRPITQQSLDFLTYLGSLTSLIISYRETLEREKEAKRREGEAEGFAKAFENLSWSLAHEVSNTSETLSLMLGNACVHSDAELLAQAIQLIGVMREASRSLIASVYLHSMHTATPDLYALAEKAQIIMSALMSIHGVECDITGDHNCLSKVNAVRILIAFISTIRNAIDAMANNKKKSVLAISVHKRASTIEVVFQDTGRGLSEKALQRCLEKGYSERKHRGGTGLWIVKQIMEDCKGAITFENAADGGARFVLTFPAA